MQSGSHYVALFIVIALGVASGNLLSNELTARYVAYKLQAKTEEMRLEREARQEKREAQLREQKELARQDALRRYEWEKQARIDSKTGRKLAKKCSDWKHNHEMLKTDTTEREARKHCEAYDLFVRQGS
ncbi:MAG: hypothetical protein EP322_00130 [Bacteroidetes bacterium]|nr:MAG: hypothetical protein EP322_00130 [Bacteroidota bacterium]